MRYIKSYYVGLLLVALITYLSLFRPPQTELDTLVGFDKLVHTGMYFVLSLVLWVEFYVAHRQRPAPWWHVWVGALGCPVAYSGLIELLQAYATSYRSGDWIDFLANLAGALLAAWVGSRMLKRKGYVGSS